MKLLLAEDTRDLNRAVAAMLEHEHYEVDCTFDGEEALDRLREDSYDGIILDIMMPKKDGLEVLKELRRRHILTPVLLLTAKAEIDDRVEGLDAGADDYLPKPFAMKELIARIRAMTRRYMTYTEREMVYGDVSLNADSLALSSRNTVRLSIKEFELMQLLMSNADIALSTDYLLEHVWREEPEAHRDIVWLYISYLKRKLSAINSAVTIKGQKEGSFRLSVGEGQ